MSRKASVLALLLGLMLGPLFIPLPQAIAGGSGQTLVNPVIITPNIVGHSTIEGVTPTGATGTGKLVFDTSPTISAPTLSGHPVIEGVTSTGATGTGNFVFDGSPTLVTPRLGVATATTVNRYTFTLPATGSTLTIADGKTLTANNSLTLAGTDSTTMTFPTTSATIARTDAANTFTGTQTADGLTLTSQTAGAATTENHASITMTATQWNGMNATPFTLITGTASKVAWLTSPVEVRYTKGSADFTNGGTVVIQWHTGAKAASGTLAVGQFTAGSTDNVIVPVAATSITQGDNLEITNGTAAFATGTGSTVTISFNYAVQ